MGKPQSLLFFLLFSVAIGSSTFNSYSPDVIEATDELFDKQIHTKSRNSYCVLFITTTEKCPMCNEVETIFNKMAHNYRRTIYPTVDEESKQIYFAKIISPRTVGKSTPALLTKLRFNTLPQLVLYKPNSDSPIRFEKDPSRDAHNKKLERSTSPILTLKKQLEKKYGKPKKTGKLSRQDLLLGWVNRLAKREKAWNGLAIGAIDKPDDGSYNEKNILQYVERNTKHKIKLEHDLPQFIKSEKVVTAILVVILAGLVLYLRVMFFPAPEPDVIVALEQLHIRGIDKASTNKDVVEEAYGRQLSFRLRRDLFPSTFWSICFILSMIAFLVVTGGFYYNTLNPMPWTGGAGRGGKAEKIMTSGRGQYGIECYMVAGVGFAINACFIALLTLARIEDPTIRHGGTVAAFFMFIFFFGVMWTFFLKKNNYFLSGMRVRDPLFAYTSFITKIIGEL
eukprot:NODE_2931_length_1457_cov_89.976012_g2538_i0.p1 GENE.NODE_2931_length_1457_cov_89.976012_g2538_i0~~NODE_2931_length_1457_cov_89.976012_g2538_i0.p1  ORF type:complete len:464 (-),score=91.97 NODE_2931_length_1457_cov_89.976012_g2538_i0:66-1418(-)